MFLAGLAGQCNIALKDEGKVYLGSSHRPRGRIRTGILALDIITGGGIIRGGATEIYGQESAGKTLETLQIVKSCQQAGGIAVWLVGEGFDVPWAVRNGVDMDRLLRIEAMAGDQGCEAAMAVLESGAADLLIFDSVQSLAPAREMESGVDSESYAGSGAPQMWGRVMRKAYAFANSGRSAHTAIILISQVRDVIGGFSKNKPAPQPTAIRSIRHWKDISVQTRAGEMEFLDENNVEKKRPLCREFHLLNTKNKTATPYRSGIFKFYFEEHEGIPMGIDHVDQLVRYGKAHDLISGTSWLEGYGLRAHGRPAFSALLREDKALQAELYNDILALNVE